MVYKILRKAGLGGYALRLIRPFLKDCGPMCHPDEARALLYRVCARNRIKTPITRA